MRTILIAVMLLFGCGDAVDPISEPVPAPVVAPTPAADDPLGGWVCVVDKTLTICTCSCAGEQAPWTPEISAALSAWCDDLRSKP